MEIKNVGIKPSSYYIGIDLGTTYSCVAVYRNGNVEIIPNQMGERTMPSVVSFTENGRLIGKEAKKQITKNYKNTVYDVKRLIGRNYSDPIVQEDMKLWPFKLEKDTNDKILICVECNKQEKKFYPEQISAMILERLKEYAEDYLNTKIKDAVITVPAYFNNIQRQATIDAGRIAGLNVIKIINEPTAAAIAYGLNEKIQGKRNICIFDLGGGTFDVTILEINDNKFSVKATGGDTHLGGEDFDNLLIKFCMKEFKKEHNIDLQYDQKAIRKLKVVAEECKKELSESLESYLEVDSLVKNIDFGINILRADFEKECKILSKCINVLNNTLKDSGLSKGEIDDIVLVGGSTRIPYVQKMLSDFFGGEKKLLKKINADEAVAYGAAIEAALHNDEQKYDLRELEVIDVCPLSLGMKVEGDLMAVIIKRNTPIPCEKTESFITVHDNQTSISIEVYEGERQLVKDNLFLDNFSINNLTKRKRGETGIYVTFAIDKDYSILNVTAKEQKERIIQNDEDDCLEKVLKKKNLQRINIEEINIKKIDNIETREITRKKRNEMEIERMIQEGLSMKNKDLEKRTRIEKINKLKGILYDLKNENNPLYEDNRNIIDKKVYQIKSWLENHQNDNINAYEEKIKEINDFIELL